jgi:dTDP-3-amino-3,4,6-trideoxy-alpha-D-glucose transaminase
MSVPFNDLSLQPAGLRAEIDAAVARVLNRGHYILGPECAAFEASFAAYLGVEHAIGVANGTDALELALRALDIGPGDEVICPALTAVPTALAVLAAGATPVFADVHPVTCTLDPQSLEPALTERTRAIIPVHLYGLCADMPRIMAFAEAHHLAVIEDCAQAHGAALNGRKAGTWAAIACFSFYPTKNLGAMGDGGAVVTSDELLAARVRQLRDLGQTTRFLHTLAGRNSRLDELQAAILTVRLAHLEANNAARRERAGCYRARLNGIAGFTLPVEPEGYTHVYHLYVAQAAQRDGLRSFLRERTIGCDIHYPTPMHHQPVFQNARTARQQLDVVEHLAGEIISLPMFPHMTREQVEAVADAIHQFYA